MAAPTRILTAQPASGISVTGRTLPSLLWEAASTYDSPAALNQRERSGWRRYSLDEFRRISEETALGLLDLGLTRGERVALYMESGTGFCFADMGCLVAGLVDVPIYLTHADDQIHYVLAHSGSGALFVSDLEALGRLEPLVADLPSLRWVVVETADVPEAMRVGGARVTSVEALRERGRGRLGHDPRAADALLAAILPQDLATIIYTSGTTGEPKGVMLTHENISHNALSAFSGMRGYRYGPGGEVALSFLPMTHVFARMLYYGFVHSGSSLYFTTPEQLSADLREVRPTVFATVPRLLEKVYGGIVKAVTEMHGPKKRLGRWALDLAIRHEVGKRRRGLTRLQFAVADLLVFRRWRAALGGRVRYVISGGAALSPKLANLFCAAGVNVLQGYGLTETSPVIAYNRPDHNRAGTVGQPLPGVEVALADDDEILTRGPHVMLGYYRDEERTRETIDEEGWLHTGDVGAIDDEGFLRITDRKKDLFKLSTGKYVLPQPLEMRLTAHPLIEHVVVVGSGYKFCAALIFPDAEALRVFARSRNLDVGAPLERLVREEVVLRRYQEIVEAANAGMDHWSTIKRFVLVPTALSVESGLLTPTLKVKRGPVAEAFAGEIEKLYGEDEPHQDQAFVMNA